MGLKENIKQKRIEQSLTLEDVAKHIGVSRQTVQKYESGIVSNIPSDKIEKMASLFHTTPAYLMGWTEKEMTLVKAENMIALPKTNIIPLLGSIACGDPILAEENIEDYVKADSIYKADFALKCRGDSMINARIFDGDIVYIRQQASVENGEIAAVLIENEATLKRVYWHDNRLELRAENPLYPALNFEGDMLGQVRIIGKAIAFTSLVR